MFKTIPSCHPCSKEFKTIHARNIHLSRHCPYRNALKPKKRAKLAHPDNEDDWDTQRGTGDDHELGMDEVGDDNELEMVEEGAYEGLVLGNTDSVDPAQEQETDLGRVPACRRKLPARYEDKVVSNRSALVKSIRLHRIDSLENLNPTSMSLDLNFHNPLERDITPTPSLDELTGDANNAPYTFYYQTEPDEFGVFKVFESSIPTVDPDENIGVNDVADAPTFVSNLGVDESARSYSNCFGVHLNDNDKNEGDSDEGWAPFLNKSIFRLMDWFYRFPKNSLTALDSLVRDVILHRDFKQSDFVGFRAKAEVKKLDKYLGQDGDFEESEDPNPPPDVSPLRDGWYRTSITIPLPHARSRAASEKDVPTLNIDGVYYRKPLEVIKEALKDPSSTGFHLQGHKLLWRRPDGELVQRLYSEVYTSDRMLEMEREIRSGPALPGPQVETVVLPIKLYSDSTVLSIIGNLSLWPIYMFFGSLSKYVSLKPSAFGESHLAYIPSLPKTIKNAYKNIYGVLPTADVLSHLKRELMQAVWNVLLNDPELIEAFVDGLILACLDGITRRFMIRWFTYSSDYPEKCLLICMCFLGEHLCYSCLAKKHMVIQLGLKRDMQRHINLPRADSENLRKRVKNARKHIYVKGRAVRSDHVKEALGDGSWTAIVSAFSNVFFEYGFDYIKMFTVDLLHEIEIGTWKAIFVHFLRILFAIDRIQVDELDNRYRQVPPFGRETIRRINDNVSELKRKTARDFEDFLQVALACFEDLLPEPHNGIIMDLIWDLATWHAYAKLRLHSDSTVESFRQVTRVFGDSLRKFVRKTCAEFDTTELEKEREKRVRCTKRKNGLDTSTDPKSELHQKRAFNTNTLKFHAMGHYPDAVVYFGTTDVYSTQPGEHAHIRSKHLWERTGKNRKFVGQLARQERRHQFMQKRSIKCGQSRPLRQNFTTDTEDSEPLPSCDPSLPYQMASGQRFYEEIPTLLASTKGDPAMNDFLFKLKNHCLQRVLNTESDTEFSDEDRRNLTFVSNLLYIHKYLRINYTTYDLRREQDSINPRTQPDVLLLAEDGEETGHPYWYARAISLFHVRVRHLGARSRNTSEQRMEIAWVRWYQLDDTIQSGWKAKRYHGLQFVPAESPDAFGFINPSQIIRAIHILPAFAYGTTSDYLPADSVARVYQSFENGEYNVEQEDWVYYYVNVFADRDIFMRFRGGGVGHVSTLEHTCLFETDAGVDEQSLPVYDKDGNVINTEEVSDSSDEEEETEEEEEGEGEEEEGSGNDDPNSDDNSDSSSDEYLDGDEEEEDLDLGPEDGEVDDIDQLGLESLGYGNY
ncbi:hypothetical protein K435DRAFT_966260 [Dendrothele bispora CBS 962.96]|uniref:C2H2-type domain-containing protein n=1 Tax=Dendrothele bispora (strain CBS 962.96) TaxID=1314807 RepID=A0A4S8M230_DENBC|nr:hypothetical protein K435DRAFT_966260 [Dendrothele bispora CBS 962.96]